MSHEAVSQFLERVQSDEQLQEELAKVIESAESSGEGADREGATELAKKYGYDFTSDELWAEIQKRQDEIQQKTGELSDEELEAVAGGESVIADALIAGAKTITAALAKKIKW